MTLFEHPLWSRLLPYAHLAAGRDNLDLLQLPEDLRAEAVCVALPCVACGSLVRVLRARLKSRRSRIAGQAEEHRLFYAATCPAAKNPGCARSRAAKDHRRRVRDALGPIREEARRVSVCVLDASGRVLCQVQADGLEPLRVDLPQGASALAVVPA